MTRTKLIDDLLTAGRFLDFMAEGEAVTFQTFDDDARRKAPALANVLHGFLDSHAARLQAFNERGAGVFWTVNFTDGGGRKAENVTAVRAVFLDLDGAPLEPVLAAGVEPHAVVESSPGKWHVYWLVNGCKLEEFKLVQQALAAKFNGDPSVNDLPRVMRLPGFIHRKGEPFLTRIESLEAFQPYQFDDLVQRLGLDLTAPKKTAPRVDPETGEIHDKVAAGGRHAHIVRTVGVLNTKGLSRASIAVAAHAENTAVCDPPLDGSEVDSIVTDLLRRYAGQHAQAPLPRFKAPPADDAGEATPTWPEPLLPGTTRVPEIDVDVLGTGWARDMAAAVAAHTQTPPAMAVLSILSVLAAVLQRRFEVAPYGDDYREPLSIWTVTALGSGNRKTAVHRALTGVLVDWEKVQRDRMRKEIAIVYAQREVIGKRIETLKLQAGKEQDAKVRQRLQDEIAELKESMPGELYAPRLFSGDITAERLQQLLVEQDERAAIVTDEGGVFQIMAGQYSGGMSSIDVFLQGHSGSSMRVDRAGRMAHLDRPALTLALALQPGILQDVGRTKRFRDSGLMARCLYAVPRSTLGTRDVRDRHPIPAKVREDYDYMVFKLLDGMQRPIGAPRVLPFDADAMEAWLDLCQRIEGEIGEGGRYAHMSDWASKLPGAAARIAGLLALADHGTSVVAVPMDAVQRAVRLTEMLIPHAEAAFALMGAADGETDAQMVLAYILRHRMLTVRRQHLQKAMEGRFRTLERLLVAIKLLQDWNVLGPEDRTHGTGRPSIFYAVNPRLFVDSSLKSHKGNLDPSSSYEEQS